MEVVAGRAHIIGLNHNDIGPSKGHNCIGIGVVSNRECIRCISITGSCKSNCVVITCRVFSIGSIVAGGSNIIGLNHNDIGPTECCYSICVSIIGHTKGVCCVCVTSGSKSKSISITGSILSVGCIVCCGAYSIGLNHNHISPSKGGNGISVSIICY